jgi:hypothetical protein
MWVQQKSKQDYSLECDTVQLDSYCCSEKSEWCSGYELQETILEDHFLIVITVGILILAQACFQFPALTKNQ